MARLIYRFGDCSLDQRARELRRAGRLQTLSPKVFDCIVYLIEHRERAVGRDELIAAVWARIDIADAQLKPLIRKVRRTVGDNGNGQTLIRTIHGFGFRWVAEIRDEEIPSSPESLMATVAESALAEAAPSHASPSRNVRLGIVATCVVLIVAGAAAFFAWQVRGRPAAEATPARGASSTELSSNLIAVLPVSVTDGSGVDTAWMPLGLMDLIANRLREAGLAVVPSSDIAALRRGERHADIERARAATAARVVVAPFLEHGDADWRMRFDVDSGTGPLQTVEARSSSAVAAARDGTDRLLSVLGGRISPDRPEASFKSELMQRIEAALLVDDNHTAKQLFDTAPAELRALPELQLAASRAEIGLRDIDAAEPRLEKLLTAASREDNSVFRAKVIAYLGGVAYYRGDLQLAISRFDESVALLENRDEPVLSGEIYARHGGLRTLQQRYDEASADFARARTAFALAGDTLDLAVVELNEGSMEAMRDRQPQALSLFRQAVSHLEPFEHRQTLIHALGNQISACLELMKPDEALDTSRRVDAEFAGLSASPNLRFVRVQQISALLANGRYAETQARIDQLLNVLDPGTEADSLALVRASQAELAFANDRWSEAVDHAAFAVTRLTGADDRDRSSTWLVLTRALRAGQNAATAAIETDRLLEWAKPRGGAALIHALIADAERTIAKGHLQTAFGTFDDALRHARETGVPLDIADVAIAYGNALLDAGDVERAIPIVGQVAEWADADFDCAVLQARLYHVLGRTAPWTEAMSRARAIAGERRLPAEIIKQLSGP